DDFNQSDIRETQLITNVRESQYHNDIFIVTTNTESPDNLFSENLFGTSLIEFEYLIVEIGLPRIHEIWSVYFIDKKSKNFIVLYDNAAHLSKAKFHIGLISQRWHTNLIATCFYTRSVHEFMLKQQWRKGFGIMKKALNLAISTGRAEELYEMHSRLVNEMEIEIARNEGRTIEQGDDLNEFAHTISQRKRRKRSEDSNNEDLIVESEADNPKAGT
ncbi:11571_t:CDS:2, partial [Gigaspora rosea]